MFQLAQKKSDNKGRINKQYSDLPSDLYHYTNSAAIEKIFDTATMLPSIRAETGDASEGDGVYFTSLPPWAAPDVLLENNFDGAARTTPQRYNETRLGGYVHLETRRLNRDAGVEIRRAELEVRRDGVMENFVPEVYIIAGREPLELSKLGSVNMVTEPERWLQSATRKKMAQEATTSTMPTATR